MKKIFILPVLCCMLLTFVGCKRSVESCSDELTMHEWVCRNPSKVEGRLSFCEDVATLELVDGTSGERRILEGYYALDSHSLYITSDDFCTTYRFDYELGGDRVDICYRENRVSFLMADDAADIATEDES